jgi:hydroxyacylglutathione hydrolase
LTSSVFLNILQQKKYTSNTIAMILKHFEVGYLPTNCYILACDKTLEGMVIDPGTLSGEEKHVVGAIDELELRVRFILNTHGHPDHTSGNRIIKEHTDAQILIHEYDAPLLAEPWLGAAESEAFRRPHRCPVCGREEMFRLEVEGNEARMTADCGAVLLSAEISPPADRMLRESDRIELGEIVLTVLHTPGHTEGGISLHCEKEGVIFTGDTLFEGSWGRTDLPGSSEKEMIGSLGRLGRLPGRTVVYPGHGAVF